MSTIGWDPGAIGTAVFGAATLLWMVRPALVQGYKGVSVYVYKRRFPDSTSILQRSLNDADIPQYEYLYRNTPTPTLLPRSEESFSHSACGNCWTTFLDIFNVLQMPLPRRSPKKLSQLPLEKDYFLTDAQTIFVCLLSLGLKPLLFSEDNGRGGQACRWESKISATFRRQNNLCLAHIQFSQLYPHRLYCRNGQRNIHEYQRIIVDGYPPWYQMKVTNTANVTFNFPSLENGNLRRGGWIVAIGLGDLTPLPYFSTKLGRFTEYGDAFGRHHRGGNGVYWRALIYLQDVIRDRFTLEAFPDAEDRSIITTARGEIVDMMRYHSASGAGKFLHECPPLIGAYNNGGFADELNSVEIEQAIGLFNHKRPLNANQISFLKAKLKPIIAGALRGMQSVFVYFNDDGFQIPAGVQKMIDDNPDIYLEGCQA